MDFGSWDGQPWSALAPEAFAAWEADFLHHPVGGGESLAQLLQRVRGFMQALPPGPALVVGHGGWINALCWLGGEEGRSGELPQAARWPAAPEHGSLTRVGGARSRSTQTPD